MEMVLSRCVVRGFRPDDAPSLARHANDRSVWINLRDQFPHPYSLADAEHWIREAAGLEPQTHFAIAVDGAAAGAIGFHLKKDVRRRSAEIGYWLGQEFWGRGIATEALRAVTGHAFGRFDLVRLYAGRRAKVARGWRQEEKRFESVTLVSPYPDASLGRLEPGTMVIRWKRKLSTTEDAEDTEEHTYWF